MRVLLVHGRGQGGKDPDKLLTEWLDTLELGFNAAGRPFPSRELFDFPFYGDVLAGFVASAHLSPAENLAAKGAGQTDEYAIFVRDVLYEMQEKHPTMTIAAARELPNQLIAEKGPENWPLVHAIARFIDQNWPDATGLTIETFLRDVYLYTTKPEITKSINQIVVDKLTDEPTVIVAHSLGTIVSYEVMRANTKTMNVAKHVTVGCPLGIKAITAELSELGVLRNQATAGWYNAYDPDDIVALNPLDKKHFPTQPQVINNGDVHNQTSNHHGIAGYLNDPAVANAIADGIESVP